MMSTHLTAKNALLTLSLALSSACTPPIELQEYCGGELISLSYGSPAQEVVGVAKIANEPYHMVWTAPQTDEELTGEVCQRFAPGQPVFVASSHPHAEGGIFELSPERCDDQVAAGDQVALEEVLGRLRRIGVIIKETLPPSTDPQMAYEAVELVFLINRANSLHDFLEFLTDRQEASGTFTINDLSLFSYLKLEGDTPIQPTLFDPMRDSSSRLEVDFSKRNDMLGMLETQEKDSLSAVSLMITLDRIVVSAEPFYLLRGCETMSELVDLIREEL